MRGLSQLTCDMDRDGVHPHTFCTSCPIKPYHHVAFESLLEKAKAINFLIRALALPF